MEAPKDRHKKKKKSKKSSASAAAYKTVQHLHVPSTSRNSTYNVAASSTTNKKGQVPDQNMKPRANFPKAKASKQAINLDASKRFNQELASLSGVYTKKQEYLQKAEELVTMRKRSAISTQGNNLHSTGKDKEKASTSSNTDEQKENTRETRSMTRKKQNALATAVHVEHMVISAPSSKDKNSGLNGEEKGEHDENCISNETIEEQNMDDSIIEVPVPPKPVPLLINLENTESSAGKDEMCLAKTSNEATMPNKTNVPDNTANESNPPNVLLLIESNNSSSCAKRGMENAAVIDKTATASDIEPTSQDIPTTSRKRNREELGDDNMMQQAKKRKSNTLQNFSLFVNPCC